jgi:hypothetical protein
MKATLTVHRKRYRRPCTYHVEKVPPELGRLLVKEVLTIETPLEGFIPLGSVGTLRVEVRDKVSNFEIKEDTREEVLELAVKLVKCARENPPDLERK